MTIISTQPVLVGLVVAELSGVANIQYYIPTGEDSPPQKMNEVKSIMKVPLPVMEARQTGGLMLNGPMSIQFKFKLPWGEFPSTASVKPTDLHGRKVRRENFCNIEYSCKFSVMDTNASAVVSDVFPIRAMAYHNYEGAHLPQLYNTVATFQRSGCLCPIPAASGSVHLATDKTVYVPGEELKLTYWVEDATDNFYELKGEITLLLNAVVKTVAKQSYLGNDLRLLNTVQKVPVKFRPGEKQCTIVTLPADTPLSYKDPTCNWIDCTYVILFGIKRRMFERSCVRAVIIINNPAPQSSLEFPSVPLLDADQHLNAQNDFTRSSTASQEAKQTDKQAMEIGVNSGYQPVTSDDIKR